MGLVVQNRQDVFFPHQEQLFLADLERFAGPGGEQNPIVHLDLPRAAAAVVEELAVADADHHAEAVLFRGGVGGTMPPAVRSSLYSRRTTTRSPRGCSFRSVF